MTSIAFIGLGVMGRPMAKNLVAAGFEVTAYSRSAGSRAPARADGIPVVDDLSALPAADVVITMLPDGPDVESVLIGENAVELRDGGCLVIDMSTIAPATSRRIEKTLAAHGHRVLDAPVSGGEAGAIEAALSIMVGGSDDAFAEAKDVFAAMGTTIVHVGGPGAGQAVKAANQVIVAGNIQFLAEALSLVIAQGVDPEAALDVLAGGLAGSTVLNRKRGNLVERNFRPGFRLALHLKDLGIAQDAARESALPLPATAVVRELVQSLVARGDGNLDHSALFKLQEELANRGGAR